MPDPRSPRNLLAPTVGTGVLMALYLLVRPYGDAGGAAEATEAFASTAWVVAHICGALAIASTGRLALRMADLDGGLRARIARTAGLVGTVLVLPYYGAETFALHEIARRAGAGGVDLGLVEAIRNNPAAMTMFGIGLVLLAGSGLLVADVWQRRGGAMAWAAWPLGAAIALILPQYYLAPELRMAFGVLYAIAAAVFVVAIVRSPQRPEAARWPELAQIGGN